MAKKETTDAVTYEAPEHGTVVNYALPGVISMTVPYGIHPDTHQQVPLDDDKAVTAEARIERVKTKASKKVVTADSKDVETA